MSLDPWPSKLHDVCGQCGGTIVWATTTANRKPMPLDADPHADGNQAVRRDGNGKLITRVIRDGETELPYERRMMPHFPTCESRGGRPDRPPRATRPPLPPAATGQPPASTTLPEGVADFAAYRARRLRR